MLDMRPGRTFCGIRITRRNRVADCAIIDHADLLQRWRLKLRIDDVHADCWEQTLELAIATDRQERAIELPARATEVARFRMRADIPKRRHGCVERCSVPLGIKVAGGRFCGEAGQRSCNVEYFVCLGQIELPNGRRLVSAWIDNTADGKSLYRFAHGIAAYVETMRQIGLDKALPRHHPARFKVEHNPMIDALRSARGRVREVHIEVGIGHCHVNPLPSAHRQGLIVLQSCSIMSREAKDR